MIMADVFKILFLILGMLLCTVSYWLLFASLFPRMVARSQQAIVVHPYRVFMLGSGIGVPLTLLGIALASQGVGPLKLLGIFFLMSITLAALFGSTGLVRQVGMGLSPRQANVGNGTLVMRGGAVVSIACVLPVVGWFLLIPVVLIAGFGTALNVWWTRQAATEAQPATAGIAGA